jgi:hypothetical protein
MSALILSASGLALTVCGLLAAAGVYTELHHAPDQP